MKIEYRALILAAALGACEKGESLSRAPDLAAPDKTLSSQGGNIPAEAEVTASSGPIQLTLRVYKTKLKPKESLWYQIELKNIGKERILVTDDIFHSIRAIRQQSWSKSHGIYLDIIGPDGKAPLLPGRSFALDIDPAETGGALPPEDTPEGANLWKRINGTNDLSKKAEIIRESWEKSDARAVRPAPVDDSFWLEPGASSTTFAWADPDRISGNALSKRPIGRFTELYFVYYEPGKYKIRAVHDLSGLIRSAKEWNHPIQGDYVRVATSYIEYEVAR